MGPKRELHWKVQAMCLLQPLKYSECSISREGTLRYLAGQLIEGKESKSASAYRELTLMAEDEFGSCRKYLAAMSARIFHPESEHFNPEWDSKTAPKVFHSEVMPLLEHFGVAGPQESTIFMRVFGYFSSLAEAWRPGT